MKVCILTEGSAKLGFGHISRCISLYQAFEEKKIIPCLIINGDEITSSMEIKNYIQWEAFRRFPEMLLKNGRDC